MEDDPVAQGAARAWNHERTRHQYERHEAQSERERKRDKERQRPTREADRWIATTACSLHADATCIWLCVLALALPLVALGLYQIITDSPDIKAIVSNIYRIIFGQHQQRAPTAMVHQR